VTHHLLFAMVRPTYFLGCLSSWQMELTRQEERYNDPLIKLKDIILWDLHEIEDCSFGIMLCVSEHRFKNNFLLQTVNASSS
jgi:hypothetical protein